MLLILLDFLIFIQTQDYITMRVVIAYGSEKGNAKAITENIYTVLRRSPNGIKGIYGGPVGAVGDGASANDSLRLWINNLEETMRTIVQKRTTQRTRQIATAICASATVMMTVGRFRRA